MESGEEHGGKKHKEHKEYKHKEHEDKEQKEHKEKEKKEHEEKEEKEHKEYKKHKEQKEHDKDYEKDYDKGRKEMGYGEEMGEGLKFDGLHLKKRDLWLVAGGALGVVAALGLGKISSRIRPAAVGAVREGYAFKEWLAGKAERVKEDAQDIYAEGVHQYHSDLSATSESVKREKDILEKIERMVEEKLAKMKPAPGEGE